MPKLLKAGHETYWYPEAVAIGEEYEAAADRPCNIAVRSTPMIVRVKPAVLTVATLPTFLPVAPVAALSGAALLAFLPAAPAIAQTLPPDADSATALMMNVEDGFTVAAVGDIIIARPMAQIDDPAFARADVAFGNFETSAIDIRNFDTPRGRVGMVSMASEILRAIHKAKRNSDFVIATIHAHDPGNWADEPPGFLVDLAHATIDAGADEFIGHGPHQLRDLYENFGLDPAEITDPEFNRRWLDLYFNDPIWYQSVIAESVFSGGGVSEIRLHPVELGFEKRGGNRGVPRAASPAAAQEILESLGELSRPFGTTIEIEEGVGVIRVR